MPSKPFGATAVDIMNFSRWNLVHLVIAQRETVVTAGWANIGSGVRLRCYAACYAVRSGE